MTTSSLAPTRSFPEGTVDLAFIDGMHLFEFALRDFINLEKLTHPGSVVLFDDALPRNNEEASRVRRSRFWAGDVCKVAVALERFRPDLVLVLVDTFRRACSSSLGWTRRTECFRTTTMMSWRHSPGRNRSSCHPRS